MRKGKKKERVVIFLILGMLFLLTGCNEESGSNQYSFSGKEATVFKSPNCQCCEGYVEELKKQGFQVTVKKEDMSLIKERYQIPSGMESCHTTVIGDYFVVGHVPLRGVKKLLEEKPEIDGIALPGMPSGSPGMSGPKIEAFKIYAISQGKASEFMIV